MQQEQLSLPLKLSGVQVVPESSEFALLEFDQAMDPLQQKLYYMTLACVDKDEDPEAQISYNIDIRRMAEFSNTDSAGLKRNMKNVVTSLSNMDLKLRPVLVEDDGLTFLFGIFQDLHISDVDPYLISVRLNYKFRKQILKMKREYDIEYPTKTILQLEGKFTIPLYTFLIAQAEIIRKQRTAAEANSVYVIRVNKEVLLRRLNYTTRVAIFNTRSLPAAIKEINEKSEIYIENGMPEIIKNGRTIVAYEFRVHITTSAEKPIFAKSLLKSKLDLIPDIDYLSARLRRMGLAESHIKHFNAEIHPNRLRIWGNMLYTWYTVGDKQPAYFRKSYDNNWFDDVCGNVIEKLFRLVVMERPEVVDDYMRAIDEEYTKRGIPQNPHFVEELLKKIASRRIR